MKITRRTYVSATVVLVIVLISFLMGVKYSSQMRHLKRQLSGYEFWRYDTYDGMVKMHKDWDSQINDHANYFLGDSHIQGLFVQNIRWGGGKCQLWNWKRYDMGLDGSIEKVQINNKWTVFLD